MKEIPKEEVILIGTMNNGLQIWKIPNKEVGGFVYYSEENGAPLPALVEALISVECLEIILNDMRKTQKQLAPDGEYWKKAIEVLDWLLEERELPTGIPDDSYKDKIIISDGAYYWDSDQDGDHPMMGKDVIEVYQKWQQLKSQEPR